MSGEKPPQEEGQLQVCTNEGECSRNQRTRLLLQVCSFVLGVVNCDRWSYREREILPPKGPLALILSSLGDCRG